MRLNADPFMKDGVIHQRPTARRSMGLLHGHPKSSAQLRRIPTELRAIVSGFIRSVDQSVCSDQVFFANRVSA